MRNRELDHLIGTIDSVPPLPLVASRMFEVAENPASSASDLAQVISDDAGLTARVLRLVNSSFYGFAREISTVTESVVLLGFEAVVNLALGITIAHSIKAGESRVLDRQRFWQHSLGAAACARILSRLVGYPNSEEAFIAGLVHDVGKLFFDEYLPDEYAAVVSQLHAGERNELRAEHMALETDHTITGQMLFRKWRLPQIYQMTTRYHHAPLQCEARLSTLTGRLVGATYLADVFTKMHGDACDAHAYIPSIDPKVWSLLRLSEEDGSRIFLMFDEEVKRAREFFGIACSDELGEIKMVEESQLRRVMILRRRPPTVSTVRIILTAAGFEVAYGLLSPGGISMPPMADPDIMIIDYDDMASSFHGILKLVSALRAKTRLGVIILRPGPTAQEEARLYERQKVYFLEKPFRANELLGKLRQVIEHGDNRHN
jgi:HD-like signal output (HDOD) protein